MPMTHLPSHKHLFILTLIASCYALAGCQHIQIAPNPIPVLAHDRSADAAHTGKSQYTAKHTAKHTATHTATHTAHSSNQAAAAIQ